MDFVALEEIKKLKLQIDDGIIKTLPQETLSPLAALNIKLGRGGIREIEFFTQSHQLLWGGRMPALRKIGTLDSLDALCEHRHITQECRDELKEAYSFFRLIEHRLQMKEDHQTHTLPTSVDDLNKLADFCGFNTTAEFEEKTENHRHRVKAYYDAFVTGINNSTVKAKSEQDQDLASLPSIIVTPDGVERAVQVLSQKGFSDPSNSALIIEGWLQGRYRALKSDRSRSVMTALLPSLLSTISKSQDPDAALAAFDRLLDRLPSGIQLFTLLANNQALQSLIIEILGNAPQLAERLSNRPALLDAVLEPGFFGALPTRQRMDQELEALIKASSGYEESLSVIRRWKSDKVFQASLHVLRSISPPRDWAPWLANVAELVLEKLAKLVAEEFSAKHGFFEVVPKEAPVLGLGILAFGKLGERIMAPGSDLDLVFIAPDLDPNEMSDGAKSLPTQMYYGRLAQRLISAITAPTAEGIAYEVDMRLRPSGSKGPLATTVTGFRRYHLEQSWTWEHMSLTRSRVILAHAEQKAAIEEIIVEVLKKPRSQSHLVQDVHKMRTRIFSNRETFDLDVKSFEGGLVDLEFIVQFLHLSLAEEHPETVTQDLETFIKALPELGALSQAQSDLLCDAWFRFVGFQAVVRLATGPKAGYAALAATTKSTLASIFNSEDLETARYQLQLLTEKIAGLYRSLIGNRALEASSNEETEEGPVWKRLEKQE